MVQSEGPSLSGMGHHALGCPGLQKNMPNNLSFLKVIQMCIHCHIKQRENMTNYSITSTSVLFLLGVIYFLKDLKKRVLESKKIFRGKEMNL